MNLHELLIKVLSFLWLIAFFQSILIAFFLLKKIKMNSYSGMFLSSILIAFGIFISSAFILFIDSLASLHYWGHLGNLTIFLIPPLVMHYMQFSQNSGSKPGIQEIIHYIPFFIIFLVMFVTLQIHKKSDFFFQPYGLALIFILLFQNVYYLYRIQTMILKIKPKIKTVKYAWFRLLVYGFLFIFSLKMVIFITWNLFDFIYPCIFLTAVLFAFAFVIMNSLLLYCLSNPQILADYSKYQNTRLNDHQISEYYLKLENALKSQQLYTNSLLSLDRLSKTLGLNNAVLSQVINQSTGKNFNDYINHYRITFAKELLTGNKRYTIIDIAFTSGFNSKSTFNTAFKNVTGMTPSAFRKHHS